MLRGQESHRVDAAMRTVHSNPDLRWPAERLTRYCTGSTTCALTLPLTWTVKFTFDDAGISFVIVSFTTLTPTIPAAGPAQSGFSDAASVFTVIGSTRLT